MTKVHAVRIAERRGECLLMAVYSFAAAAGAGGGGSVLAGADGDEWEVSGGALGAAGAGSGGVRAAGDGCGLGRLWFGCMR